MTIENSFLTDNLLKSRVMKKNKHNFECVVDKQKRFSKYLGEQEETSKVEGNSDDHKRKERWKKDVK